MAVSRSMKCSKCGYELLGLSNRGHCPECGASFDKDMRKGVTDGSDMNRGDRILRRVRTIAVAVLALFVIGCGGCFQWLVPHSRSLAIGLVVGAVFVLGAVVSYVYENDD